ncbi:MAG TPA: hypothetical protein VJR03_01915, partial [Nitrospira sp.]|nr:hypothetical protein [Nitrospira sp.]
GVAALSALLVSGGACSSRADTKNSLQQNTGEVGSTVPKSHPPYYPNTSGNIIAPPGNPAGNSAGSPPITGGTENQQAAWPDR